MRQFTVSLYIFFIYKIVNDTKLNYQGTITLWQVGLYKILLFFFFFKSYLRAIWHLFACKNYFLIDILLMRQFAVTHNLIFFPFKKINDNYETTSTITMFLMRHFVV